MLLKLLALYASAGLLGGGLLGLLGVGCGIVCVPMLALLLPTLGIPNEVAMQMAIATSLAVIVPTTCSSVYAHHVAGNVRWDIVNKMVGGSVVGAILGASTAHFLPAADLKFIFALAAIFISMKMFFNLNFKATSDLPSSSVLLRTGGIIAYFCSAIGLGGGVVTVPWLTSKKVTIHQAVATSTALGFPLSLSALVTICIFSSHVKNLPAYSFGYVNMPAFAVITICSVAASQLSARLSHKVPVETLKKIFAVALFIAACDILASLLR